jgi:hypothetical protein
MVSVALSINARGLYSGDAQFDSRPGKLVILTEGFLVFLSPYMQMLG